MVSEENWGVKKSCVTLLTRVCSEFTLVASRVAPRHSVPLGLT
jgi:hypothetical protein